MSWRIALTMVCLVSLLSSCGSPSAGEGGGGDEATIRKKSAAFVDAYNKHDLKALGSLWAEDAIYDLQDEEPIEGREAIIENYRTVFDTQKDAHVELQINKITFPKPDQAVEAGAAVVQRQGEDPVRTAYKAYYRKDKGDWILTQVREVLFSFPPTNYEHLKELEWLVGEWVDEDEDLEIVNVGQWDKYKNFLTQHFTVSLEGQVALEGKQIIAWDPIKQKIRSWMFDSDGGFGEGTWKKDGKAWLVENAQTLPDGTRASAINIYTPVDADHYTFESTGRDVGGELLPDIKPVTVERKKG